LADREAVEQEERTSLAEELGVRIYIMGKEYRVPAGLTIMKAMEYAGYKFIRGAGCRAGFCGACGTVYRKEGEYKLRFAVACQKLVEDGMFLVQLPFAPAPRVSYDLEKLRPTENVLLKLYPELARCVACNTCTKACPQEIPVMDYIQAALRGGHQARRGAIVRLYPVRPLLHALPRRHQALPCGPARPPPLRAVSRPQGRAPRPKGGGDRGRRFDEELDRLTRMGKEELSKLYEARQIEEGVGV
jgi:ferredoxin